MKNVLIIGGSSDIGVSLAKYLTKKDYHVIATYYKHKITLPDIEYLKCDITNEEELNSLFTYVIDKYGKDLVLINMASISLDNSLEAKTKEEFMQVLETNLVGPFLTSKIYAKYIQNGLIINIASTDGISTYSIYSMDYSASKAGLINLSKSMSLATSNKVVCIAPNWIDSFSTRSMDKNYLNSELKRIKQSRLITKDEFNQSIDKIIANSVTGDVFILDVKDDKLWIQKI